MKTPIQEFVFHEIDGTWQDANGNVLADVLSDYEILVDDRCQFARLYDYERGVVIYYRVFGGRISIQLWEMAE